MTALPPTLVRYRRWFRFLKPVWGGYRLAMARLPWRWAPGTSRSWGPPRGGVVSVAGYLASPSADPRDRAMEVFPGGVIVRRRPGGAGEEIPWQFRNLLRQAESPTRVYELHGIRFWGDYAGTLIGRDDRVLSDLTTDVWGVRRHRIFTRLRLPAPGRLSGTVAVLAAAEAATNYWHWTLDVLPRLHALLKAGFPPAAIDWFVVNHRDRGFQRETLEDLGVPWAKVVRADARLHLECDRVVTTSLKPDRFAVSAEDCTFLNARASGSGPDGVPRRRLFASRRGAPSRRLKNEDALFALLKARGFERIDCETLPVAEQRRLFRDAAVVVGPHGAALTNLVYCRPGTRVLELLAPGYIDPSYWCFAHHAGLVHWILIGEGPRPPEGIRPFLRHEDIVVDPGRFESMVDRLIAGMTKEGPE